jgi:hypothetical protein
MLQLGLTQWLEMNTTPKDKDEVDYCGLVIARQHNHVLNPWRDILVGVGPTLTFSTFRLIVPMSCDKLMVSKHVERCY